MSSSVDSRIVTMKFENSSFERGVQTSLGTLGRLKAAMNFGDMGAKASGVFGQIGSSISGMFSKFGVGLRNPFTKATEGVGQLQSATNRFDPGPIVGGVTGISKSFVAMSTIAITALASVTAAVGRSAANFVNSFTFAPINDGFDEFELKMGSIQAILANTDGSSLDDVNRALNDLNHYSDKTIYNFGEMVSNIKTFTVAGIDLKTSVSSVKGLANVAALTGTNATDAARATYQMAQAMSSGSVRLQDWISMEHAGGMAGKIFQDSLIRTAKTHGVNVDQMIKKNGSFRLSLSEGWLSTDILTETLGQFSGAFSKAQLAQMGYTEKQIKDIQALQRQAQSSAQDVKTFTALVGTIKETVGSGWATTFETVFGNLNEGTKLWTGINNTLGSIISNSSKARNKMLKDWKDLGGRTALIEGIKNAWYGLMDVLSPIQKAFRDIFPKKTGQDLYNLTVQFLNFTKGLRLGEDTMDNLRATFRGVFAVFDIVGQAIGALVGMIFNLFQAIGKGSGGFLEFTGGVGDFLVALDNAIRKGHVFQNFFSGIGAILAIPLKILGAIGKMIVGLFTGFNTEGVQKVGDALNSVGERLSPLASAGERFKAVFEGIGTFFAKLGNIIGDAMVQVGEAIAGAFTPDTFNHVLDVINTGLLAGIVLLLKNFFSGNSVKLDFGGGLFDGVKKTLGEVTTTLQQMQTGIKADVIMKIAAALAVLTASIFVLSMIDPKRLASALTGMAIGMAALQVALVKLTSALSMFGSLKLPLIAVGLLGLAGALLLLSLSVKILASMDFADMLRGLSGIAIMLFVLQKAVVPLSANAAGMVRVGAGITLLAIGLTILAGAVKLFASMNWAEMAKGLVGVGTSLLILAGAMKLMPRGILLQAAGLAILAVALNGIGLAVKVFGSMDIETMAKGLVGIGAALVIIAAAMKLMPLTLVVQAAGMMILAGALNVMGLAIAQMGGMSIEQIATGLVTMAAALVILAGGLYLMSGSIVGAAALIVAAAALAVMAPVLVVLGALSWEAILKGLTMLAGVFVILGVAGALLGPVVPVIGALAVALVVMGAGLALAGAGALMFATAFGILVTAGAAGVAVLNAMLSSITAAIPGALKAFAVGIVKFAQVIAANGPAFVRAISTMISSMLNAMIKNIPKFGQVILLMLTTGLKVINRLIPQFVSTAIHLILSFLQAVNKNISRITPIAISIVVKFINAVANRLPSVIEAGVNLILKFINGVSHAIDAHSGEMGAAGGRLAVAIIRGMANGILNGLGAIAQAAVSVAKSALGAAKKFLGVSSPSKAFHEVGMWSSLGMAQGISTYSHVVDKAAAGVGKNALSTLKATMSGMSGIVSDSMDTRPVISPVLDLTDIQRNAGQIGSLLASDKMQANLSYKGAAAVSAELAAAARMSAKSGTQAPSVVNKFEQTNISPKPLDPITIYRNTRNLMSLAKGGSDADERFED